MTLSARSCQKKAGSVLSDCARYAHLAVHLSAIHKDPFDRMIIATALIYGAQLASVDKIFPQYLELKTHLMTIEEIE